MEVSGLTEKMQAPSELSQHLEEDRAFQVMLAEYDRVTNLRKEAFEANNRRVDLYLALVSIFVGSQAYLLQFGGIQINNILPTLVPLALLLVVFGLFVLTGVIGVNLAQLNYNNAASGIRKYFLECAPTIQKYIRYGPSGSDLPVFRIRGSNQQVIIFVNSGLVAASTAVILLSHGVKISLDTTGLVGAISTGITFIFCVVLQNAVAYGTYASSKRRFQNRAMSGVDQEYSRISLDDMRQ
jgi:hypothetical protein